MLYSSGNYEAFARPRKPKDVENKSAWIVGSGLAALATAAFLVRDGQMEGSHIHLLEILDVPGGACDGVYDEDRKGYVMRGGREMEAHFECLWDLYRSIPSLEIEGASVLDEFYWLNKDDPNISPCRTTINRGKDALLNKKFALSDQSLMDLMNLFMSKDEDLYGKRLDEVVGPEFFESNFWLYWCTMFGFEPWHGALEVKIYMQRFCHGMSSMADFSSLKFTKYNEYESLILPLVKYLQEKSVQFEYGCCVTNVEFAFENGKKIAKRILLERKQKEEVIELTENDLVFVTNASCTDSSVLGDNDNPAILDLKDGEGACWQLWKNIAAQDNSFGHPERFCSNIEATKWESCTITTFDKRIPGYIEKITKRDPFNGMDATGGIITVKDSSWFISYGIKRQPVFKTQKEDEMVTWMYALYSDRLGDYIKKPITECSGNEIVQEWLYHIGVPKDEIATLARESAVGIPCMMPYITAFFMPRFKGDFPKVVPDGCVNFAFIGQFVDTERDPVFTTEKSVRTAMEAVYSLLKIERAVPEVFGSVYDVRYLVQALPILSDGKKLSDLKLSVTDRIKLKEMMKMLENTEAEELMKKSALL
ncbi:MAG: oleate hydratase [Erysipelotrichaceae bacterium]